MAAKFTFTYALAGSRAPTARPAAEGLRSADLFPTRIWQVQLTALAPHLADWVAQVEALRAANPAPAGRSNRQGWNSVDMTVLERPPFAPLRAVVRAACQQALTEMGQGQRSFELQSWINLHDRGGFNFLHQHEGSLLSGSFYLQVPPGAGDFVFRDPRPGVIHGFAKGGMPNAHSDVHLKPTAGLLVLFPCWIEHYVEPHEGDQPRITIAFNANTAASEPQQNP